MLWHLTLIFYLQIPVSWYLRLKRWDHLSGIPLGSLRKHRHGLSEEKLFTSVSISQTVQDFRQLSLSQLK